MTAHDPPSSQMVVCARELSRVFSVGQSKVQALREVTLTVPRGAFAAFVGRSGSGKTTLLNLLGGLDAPTSGSVSICGQELSSLSEQEMTELRRKRIGFVFQSYALLPTLSAFENVELPLCIAGVRRAQRAEEARRCLDLVGLSGWSGHRPYEMSGGQQQRVAIARALVNRPDLIIADEPTAELDSVTGRAIVQLFAGLVREGNLCVLMASHDSLVREYATIVHQLRDGQLVQSGVIPR